MVIQLIKFQFKYFKHTKLTFLIFIFFFLPFFILAQTLPGFKISGSFDEQQMVIENSPANTRILINAPLRGFEKNKEVLLVFYALPNGNSIEQTYGKKLLEGDDWHFDIQHIGAQTRFLRKLLTHQTLVVAYLESSHKSWPAWKKGNPNFLQETKNMVEVVTSLFKSWKTQVALNGHSGGGRFIFNYLESVGKIPDAVRRISFLDSSYGYEDTIHGPQLITWLKSGKNKFLSVLAYNDSVVVFNDKPLVSPTGGTWYRSKMMKDYLGSYFHFREDNKDSLLWYTSPSRRLEFILKTNPYKKIYHTTQVELNGFIHSILSGTKDEQKGYDYFGKRAYSEFIADSIIIPIRRLNIPPRTADAESGYDFMNRMKPLALADREAEIYKALSNGNMPEFLRQTIGLHDSFVDSKGILHQVEYEVMPDYLAIGSDSNFCRIPMNPHTAQRLATLFGASLITSRLSDHIYHMAPIKLAPFPYTPVGNANETIEKFIEHNTRIEKQKVEVGAKHGQLIAGIKKDIILSLRIAKQPDRVVIYGWHKTDGVPIQPVYSGHVDWYVDYSHGIRLINNQIMLDGKQVLLTDILKDPILYKIFSDEDMPMNQTTYD